jgi:hypothetical protein
MLKKMLPSETSPAGLNKDVSPQKSPHLVLSATAKVVQRDYTRL